MSISNLTASPTLPRGAGTTITFTATAAGVAPLQYRFWRKDAGVWNIVRDFSTDNTYTWTTTQTDIGAHDLIVWVKTAASTASYDAWREFGSFNILSPATITALTASPSLPRPVRTVLTFTATATGTPGPLVYRFYRKDGATWSMVQDYSISRSYIWTTTNADIGQHDISVWVRNSTSTAPYQDWRSYGPFNVIGTATVSALTVSPAAPSPAGKPIVFTATATGSPGPLEYQFWRNDGTGFGVAQPYSPSNQYTWIPGRNDPGTHDVTVWVRSLGSPLQYEAWRNVGNFAVAPAQPLAVTALASAPPMPRQQGSIVLWKPVISGGYDPLTYRFWRYSYATGAWAIVQDYSAADTFTWTTTPADVGKYQMVVWVKNAGSTSTTYDQWIGTPDFFVTPPTTDIARFLEQASFGPSDASIEEVRTLGMSGWIDAQFNAPPTGFPPFPPVTDQAPATCIGTCQRDNYSIYPIQRQFYLNALYGQDQLRQRVAFALHSLVVTSGFDLPLPSWFQPYLDILNRNAFGNYRQLLYEVTLNPGMGIYLDLSSSTKNNPNENYAREILQLFATGTDQLNLDGTPQTLANGDIIPVYDQFQVDEFARVFTGWRFATPIGNGITNYRDPMVPVTANHDLNPKILLGGFTTAGGATPVQDMNDAIDNIFNHPNVGPYVAKNLIKSLVTSNPTPAYVARIATVFNNNGSGVRGDMKAVIKAILLDTEARQAVPVDPSYGHLKNPVLFMTGLLRSIGAASANGLLGSDGYLAPTVTPLGMDTLRPPSVFSYYPADYVMPGTTVSAPEFAIFESVTTLRRANVVNTLSFSTIPVSANAPNGTSLNLSTLKELAVNPNALIKELDRTLMHDSMSAAMKTAILNAVNAVSPSNPMLRAQTALYLVATSSQYQVER